MGFLVQVDPLTLLEEHRVYLAEQDGRLVAFLTAAPIFARPGWLLQNLIRAPDAPNGTSEILVDHAMRDAGLGGGGRGRAHGDARPRPPRRPGRPGAPARAVRRARCSSTSRACAPSRPDCAPRAGGPIHLVYPPEQGSVRTVLDVLEAFAREPPADASACGRFLRGPTIVVRLLAALLVPWTVLLALADGWHFPAEWVRWAWVAFDVLLAASLFRLAVRWSDRLSRILLAAVGADALLTLVEVLAWNGPRLRGPRDALVSLVAVAAPALAFVILWRARVRRHAPP